MKASNVNNQKVEHLTKNEIRDTNIVN